MSDTIGFYSNQEKRRWFEVRFISGYHHLPSDIINGNFETFSDALKYVKENLLEYGGMYEIIACDRIRLDSYLTQAVELEAPKVAYTAVRDMDDNVIKLDDNYLSRSFN